MKIMAKNKQEYEQFKKEIELLIKDRESMKDGVVERINHYRKSQMYTNAEEYKNKVIAEEEELLDSIEKQLEGFRFILNNLNYKE